MSVMRFRGSELRLHWLAGLAATLLTLTGCSPDLTGLGVISVPELAALLESAAPVAVCDANGEDVRAELGTIPGARLLSSYNGYDVAAELPSERAQKLVFYCYSPSCSSASAAARRAVAAGYTNVSVLPDGIVGWLADNRPAEMPPTG